LHQVWRARVDVDRVHASGRQRHKRTGWRTRPDCRACDGRRHGTERIGTRWRSLRVDAPHEVVEARSQVGAKRARKTARRDGTEFVETRQFLGGVLKKAKSGGLQGSWIGYEFVS
jgi:hypothetical protein